VTITVDPILVSFGSLAMRWYGLLALAGLGLAVWLSLRELRRQGLGWQLALDGLAWALPIGLVGARAVHVLGYWDYYLTNQAELWRLNLDGLSLWGGLATGGVILAARLGRGGSVRRRRILDTVAPYALLGIAVGRIGEFLDGQGQGLPSDLPWATQYANPQAATPDFGIARHPVQLYDAAVAAGLFAVLAFAAARLPAGTRAAVALACYGIARLVMGAVRLDPAFAFGLQIEQLLALGAVATGIVFGVRPLLQRMVPSRLGRVAEPSSAVAPASSKEDSLAA
jgi:phosphatidylglycerol---prolipoprotein diacylglyceryl transferase